MTISKSFKVGNDIYSFWMDCFSTSDKKLNFFPFVFYKKNNDEFQIIFLSQIFKDLDFLNNNNYYQIKSIFLFSIGLFIKK